MIASVREWSGNLFDRAERFVVLQLENISVVVLQSDVVALEPVLDMHAYADDAIGEGASARENSSGYLSLADGQCPVFALNADLQCLAYVPDEHRICAVIKNRQANYALSCVAVELLSRADIVFHPTPRSMLNPRSPVLQLMVHAGKLLLATTASSMYAHLVTRTDGDVISFEQHIKRMKS